MLRRFLRRTELAERIKIEIVLARDARHVRAEEAAADEERSILVLLQELDATIGDLRVGMVGAVSFGLEPAKRSAQPPAGQQIDDVLFFVLASAARIDDLVP